MAEGAAACTGSGFARPAMVIPSSEVVHVAVATSMAKIALALPPGLRSPSRPEADATRVDLTSVAPPATRPNHLDMTGIQAKSK